MHAAMTTFAITGMTCNGCRSKVETTLQALAPDMRVTLDPPVAKTSAAIDMEVVNAALAAVGKYRASALLSIPEASVLAWLKPYYPLALILGLIALAATASGTWMGWMMNFMGGFYIVFGAFKLLDVPAFANAYARYDIVAKRFRLWGYVYPFVEVALGLGFLFWFDMITLSWIALVLSAIGAIGVVQAVWSKQTIQCACLGTVFQLPMSVVTVVENLGMAAMAAWMIWGMM
jgi:copper chaperone CopZ